MQYATSCNALHLTLAQMVGAPWASASANALVNQSLRIPTQPIDWA